MRAAGAERAAQAYGAADTRNGADTRERGATRRARGATTTRHVVCAVTQIIVGKRAARRQKDRTDHYPNSAKRQYSPDQRQRARKRSLVRYESQRIPCKLATGRAEHPRARCIPARSQLKTLPTTLPAGIRHRHRARPHQHQAGADRGSDAAQARDRNDSPRR